MDEPVDWHHRAGQRPGDDAVAAIRRTCQFLRHGVRIMAAAWLSLCVVALAAGAAAWQTGELLRAQRETKVEQRQAAIARAAASAAGRQAEAAGIAASAAKARASEAAIQADALPKAVRHRSNLLIAGGTSSGKTTLVNALLAEIAGLDERVILIEDTRELQCAAADCVALRTRTGVVSMADLVRSTLRLRPDRIIVGEVRGGEALDMLKAWNTGHPGGIATVHANSARSALYRLEQLVQENVVTVPRRLIAEAIDLVVFIQGRGTGRRIETIAEVTGLDGNGDYAVTDLAPHRLHTL